MTNLRRHDKWFLALALLGLMALALVVIHVSFAHHGADDDDGADCPLCLAAAALLIVAALSFPRIWVVLYFMRRRSPLGLPSAALRLTRGRDPPPSIL